MEREREQGTGNKEQGRGNKEQGTGNGRGRRKRDDIAERLLRHLVVGAGGAAGGWPGGSGGYTVMGRGYVRGHPGTDHLALELGIGGGGMSTGGALVPIAAVDGTIRYGSRVRPSGGPEMSGWTTVALASATTYADDGVRTVIAALLEQAGFDVVVRRRAPSITLPRESP